MNVKKIYHSVYPLSWIILTAIATLWAYIKIGTPLYGVDDANIFFVYSRNLADGYGFVFYPGGEIVEGFTSLAWVLFGSLFVKAMARPEFGLLTFNILWVSFSCYFFYNCIFSLIDGGIQNRSYNKTLILLVFLGWILLPPAYVIWSVLSLMEVGWWSGLLLISFGLIIKYELTRRSDNIKKYLYCLIILLLLITRPEGIIWSLFFCLTIILLDVYFIKNKNEVVKKDYYLILFFLIALSGLTGYRYFTFGYPLPNTYYAKVSSDYIYNLTNGYIYLKGFLFSNRVLLSLVILNIALMIYACINLLNKNIHQHHSSRNVYLVITLLSCFMITGLLIPIINGGDHFALFRFYQPIWPIIILPVLVYIKALSDKVNNNITPLIKYLICIIVFLCIYTSQSPRWDTLNTYTRIIREFNIAVTGRNTGSILNNIFISRGLPLPSVGEVTVGGLAYEYKGPVIDLMGLNNIEMAHASGDKKGVINHAAFNLDVFYSQTPDLLLPRVIETPNVPLALNECGKSFESIVLKGLFCEQRFNTQYVPGVITISKPDETIYLFAFFRRDYIEVINKSLDIILLK